jgi:hypothetical protein
MSIRKGERWERPATGPAQITVAGDDAALSAAVAANPGARFAFHATDRSDFARAVGAGHAGGQTAELRCDALDVNTDGTRHTAVNMVVIGAAPDRQRWWSRSRRVLVRVDDRVVHDGGALGVVVANGQHLRGRDVVPRGHPGDGRIEVQVYALGRRERAQMRARLSAGTHVPHPRIVAASGRRVEVWAADGLCRLEVDGHALTPVARLTVTVVPEAFTLLV